MEVNLETQPLEVAIAAGKLAANAIESRAKTSTAVKGDENSAFTPEECQLVAGRIVGVIMRWNELEALLIAKVKATAWVIKYGEEASFGILSDEYEYASSSSSSSSCKDEGTSWDDTMLKQRLKDDPLLRMCRAECLYALFLRNVEMPRMVAIGQISANGDGGVDFLDADRVEVLFPDGFD